MKLSKLVMRLRLAPHPVRLVVSRLLWASRLCRLFVIRRDGYRLHFYPTSVSAALWEDPQGWNFDEYVFSSVLDPGDKVVDVGANVGSLALKAASLVGPAGAVLCFEANPLTCTYLQGNIRLNRMTERVKVMRCALGETSGTIRFARSRADGMDHVISAGGLRVPIRRLDDAIDDPRRIALLKIDVEGYEIPVLRGAIRALELTNCVYVESFERQLKRYGFSTRDLRAFLVDHAFDVYRYSEGHWRSVTEYFGYLREFPCGFQTKCDKSVRVC